MYHLSTFSVGLFLIAFPVLAQEEASFQGLGDLPGGDLGSAAYAISPDGSVIVGRSSSENGNIAEAFRWENGEMEGLGDLPGNDFYSEAQATSSGGSVIVGFSHSENGAEAFRWSTKSDSMEGLGTLPGGDFFSQAFDVSSDGSVIAGWSSSEEYLSEAFRWESGEMEGLGVLPNGDVSIAYGASADGSVVTGFSSSTNGIEAFRWEDGEMEGLGDLPGGDFQSRAFDISSDGSVIVGDASSHDGLEPFRWESGKMEGLGDLPGGEFGGQALSVSADGSVVLGYSSSADGFTAFIWTEEEGMRSLKEVLEEDYDLDLTDWDLIDASDISEDGMTIVGSGTNFNPEFHIEGYLAFLGKPVANEATPEALADVLSAPRPNPASEVSTFTITVEQGQHVAVEVFDVMGRHVQTVYEGALAAGMSETLTLDASALPTGVYMIRATGEDFTRTRRVTVVQ